MQIELDHAWDVMRELWQGHPLGQIFGLLAMMFYLTSTLQKNDRYMYGLMLIGSFAWIFHYGLLGAWVASLTYIIGLARNGVAYFKVVTPETQKKYTLGLVCAYIMVAITVARNFIDLFPCAGSILYVVAMMNARGIRMRLIIMGGQVLYFIYALSVGSIGGSIDEAGEFLFTGLTVLQLRRTAASMPQGQ